MQLYIHIPFCKRKCRYCDFVSYTDYQKYKEIYIDALLREFSFQKKYINDDITTIYIGGGTPSLLDPVLFVKLIDGIRSLYPLNNLREFTVEANPGTLTDHWMNTIVNECGVNRISLGMQAFQDDILTLLGRIHCFDDVVSSVDIIKQNGIKNFNLDLMFGIPDQTSEQWLETLSEAIDLKPTHISAYGLIPEEGTPLYRDIQNGSLSLPDVEEERTMYYSAKDILRNNGFLQYEISNFSHHGYECIHNIGYWNQSEYLGLGVSAASLVSLRSLENCYTTYERLQNPSDIRRYLRMISEGDLSVQQRETVNAKESIFETVMLGLRMNRGITEDRFFRMHGKTLSEQYGEKLEKMLASGLLLHEKSVWRLSEKGMDLQNTVLVELMDDQ